jgi:NAD(P)-dependent dehydrogenase (short-subunit alcohol dehydrogenase family)
MGSQTFRTPPQTGRFVIVTGGTGGLGFETASALAAAGGDVVLAGRSEQKGHQALDRLLAAHPGSSARFEHLDLASLASVADFAGRMTAAGRGIDLLVNNAGVMAPPERHLSADGFELQFATNYLGHFALTAHLLPLLRQSPGARVVSVSSLAAHVGSLHLADLNSERAYAPFRVYAMSKLSLLSFTFEFQRRSRTAGWGVDATAAHPGWARTDIISNGPASRGLRGALWGLAKPLLLPLSPRAERAAVPILFAATSPDARGGGFYGPTGPRELQGPAGEVRSPAMARNPTLAGKLWDISEGLAQVDLA